MIISVRLCFLLSRTRGLEPPPKGKRWGRRLRGRLPTAPARSLRLRLKSPASARVVHDHSLPAMAIAVTMATSRPSVVVSSLLFPTSDHLCEFLEILDFGSELYRTKVSILEGRPLKTRLTCRLFCNRRRGLVLKCCMHQLLAKSSYSTYESKLREQNGLHFKNLNDRKIVVPNSDPPSVKDVNLLYQFIDRRYVEPNRGFLITEGACLRFHLSVFNAKYDLFFMKLKDCFYNSPNGAYSTGFKPITHQVIRLCYDKLLVVQSYFFRLHHRAGSDPLELHGTVYSVVCLKCGNSINRDSFQDRVKALNPKVCYLQLKHIIERTRGT
ncbi:hypothetical protein B296_00019979 [Ensete ventricosum]|uniref:Deacetylase sirtuin-type domain-containing protein n=1 Tax=Ensete ventricosum TaxID=4639 RepID=A0A427A8U4_ENSVE|nr:hypothetical protein B296_00019979 [Ensete ventricosum]